jgi:hypothetical protein
MSNLTKEEINILLKLIDEQITELMWRQQNLKQLRDKLWTDTGTLDLK